MKILLITRLMSGFEASLKRKVWEPTGSVAIARMIEKLAEDPSVELSLIMTRAFSRDKWATYEPAGHKKTYKISGLGTDVHVLAAKPLLRLPSRLAFLWVELCHLISVLLTVWQKRPDIIYLERSNWLIAGVLARVTRRPIFLRMLGIPPDMWRIGETNALFNLLMRWAFRAPFAHVLCTEDGSAGTAWMSKFLNSAIPRTTALNGVGNGNWESNQNELVESADQLKVVFVGRVEALKGADFFVKALLSIPKEKRIGIHVVIVGGGALLEDLKSDVRASGADNFVHFTGSVPSSEVEATLKSADLYVSLNKQGHLSNANLEAVAFGIPVMIKELNRDFEPLGGIDCILPRDSLLVLPASAEPEELGSFLVSLSQDKVKLSKLGDEVRKARDEKLVTWEERVNQEIKLLRELASEGKGND
ncbi:glycosyltransferase family 4 protein [Thalassospira povalilytica]|uniref:glycosyltransferase family 4 protein n=1 Tax=Thalassospira povalilytica TaxID=732237 RepID=UPI003AA84D4A